MTATKIPKTTKNARLNVVTLNGGTGFISGNFGVIDISNLQSRISNIKNNYYGKISEINKVRYLYTESFKSTMNNIDYQASINGYHLPNDTVKTTAIAILTFFESRNIKEYEPTPLSEGGIGFEFTHYKTYYNIKIDNEGDGVFYKEEQKQIPQGWDLTFPQLLKKLKSEFDAMR